MQLFWGGLGFCSLPLAPLVPCSASTPAFLKWVVCLLVFPFGMCVCVCVCRVRGMRVSVFGFSTYMQFCLTQVFYNTGSSRIALKGSFVFSIIIVAGGHTEDTDNGWNIVRGVCVSRCDYHVYVFLTSSIIYLWFFFTLGIMHNKLIFIYLIIPDVGGMYLTACDMYFTYTIPEGKL